MPGPDEDVETTGPHDSLLSSRGLQNVRHGISFGLVSAHRRPTAWVGLVGSLRALDACLSFPPDIRPTPTTIGTGRLVSAGRRRPWPGADDRSPMRAYGDSFRF